MLIATIALVAFLVLSVLAAIATIDKPREPLTAGMAMFILIVNALIVSYVIWLYGRASA